MDAIKQGAGARWALPQTLTGSFQGTAQAFQRVAAHASRYLIAAALIAVYIILGMLYESYIHPLTILSTLPSAGVGALLILMAGGYDLNVIALIGIILLIGIVKKNGIMMVDFALTAEREQGMTPEEAIYQACLLRFRPILMTTMCALLGGLPLMLGHGTGSELRQPLGFAIVGGLILSQVLTLFTTPVVYLYLDRAHYWYVSRKEARRKKQGGETQRPADYADCCRRRRPRRREAVARHEAADRRRRAQDHRLPEKGLTEQGCAVDLAHDGIDGRTSRSSTTTT